MLGVICLVIAAILFFCAALSWALGPINLVSTGLLFFVLGHLLGSAPAAPAWPWRRRSE